MDDTPSKRVNKANDRGDRYNVNYSDYDVMNEAMKNGKTMLIAAHYSPIYDGVLPNRPGFAAIYLALEWSAGGASCCPEYRNG